MRIQRRICLAWGGIAALVLAAALGRAGDTFTIVTYNLENYIDHPGSGRPEKTAASKAKIRQILLSMRPDVLAVEEIGLPSALLELRASLRREGLDYPYWEHAGGYDTNIFLGLLSRFPIVARRPHTNDTYLLHGRRFQVSRGFLEADIRVNSRYRFTLLSAHLKSKRRVPWADQEEMREEEAKILREKIEAILSRRPEANVVVVGDFNDTKDSRAVKIVRGLGRFRLIDTRPAERNGDTGVRTNPRYDPRTVTWTHFYGAADAYERIDYILLSPGMAREWIPKASYVFSGPDWGLASDHRPVAAGFAAEDR